MEIVALHNPTLFWIKIVSSLWKYIIYLVLCHVHGAVGGEATNYKQEKKENNFIIKAHCAFSSNIKRYYSDYVKNVTVYVPGH